jgi:hypothetical protein
LVYPALRPFGDLGQARSLCIPHGTSLRALAAAQTDDVRVWAEEDSEEKVKMVS